MAAPGVASKDSAEREPGASDGAMGFERFESVGRAGWLEPAGGRTAVADDLVTPHEEVQEARRRAHVSALPLVRSAPRASSTVRTLPFNSSYVSSVARAPAVMR